MLLALCGMCVSHSSKLKLLASYGNQCECAPSDVRNAGQVAYKARFDVH